MQATEYTPGEVAAGTGNDPLNVLVVTFRAVEGEPPSAVRSQATPNESELGFWPGVIVPESVTVPPGAAGLGAADPVAVGLIEIALVVTVTVTSSMAIPSSLPGE